MVEFSLTNKKQKYKTGEIGRKIREQEVAEERQFILGLVASVKFQTSAKILWPIYCKLKDIRIMILPKVHFRRSRIFKRQKPTRKNRR